MERPEAIIITMSALNVKEWGGCEQLNRFFSIHYGTANDRTFWYRLGRSLPRFQNLLYIYLVFANRIQWRFNLVSFEHTDGVMLYNPHKGDHLCTGNHVIMTGPAVKMDIPFKGFQGFRYTPVIY